MEGSPQIFEYHEFMEDYEEPFEKCAQQVAIGTARNIMFLVGLVFGFKIIKNFQFYTQYALSINVLTTIIVVASFSGEALKALVIFNAFSLLSLKLAQNKVRGYFVLVLNICLLIAIQIISTSYGRDEFFLSVRGILMLHIMRLTTVAFDTENSSRNLNKLSQFKKYIEYVYYPPLIIFGPYLTYKQFARMQNKKLGERENEIGQFLKFAFVIFFAITLAIISSCQFEFYETSSQFIEDALTAASFRYSHYFVCMISYAFIMFLGSDVTVMNPIEVELPRSVLLIVSEWNKPFHTFLHTYVFRRRFFSSTALNVLLTFLVSSLLHGLDFQMTITLLALGFIAYSETVFRKRLAARLSMCIAAKPCQVRNNRLTCNHRCNQSQPHTVIVNTAFMILAIYHLIFTGMTFTDDYSAIGYPLDHAVTIWGTHYYASFVISLIFLTFSKII